MSYFLKKKVFVSKKSYFAFIATKNVCFNVYILYKIKNMTYDEKDIFIYAKHLLYFIKINIFNSTKMWEDYNSKSFITNK